MCTEGGGEEGRRATLPAPFPVPMLGEEGPSAENERAWRGPGDLAAGNEEPLADAGDTIRPYT